MDLRRRDLIKKFGRLSAVFVPLCALPLSSGHSLALAAGDSDHSERVMDSDFEVSLAQWSLHKSFFGKSLDQGWGFFIKTLFEDPDALLQGPMNPDYFPAIAKNQFGIDTIELVNTFYFSRASDQSYWDDFKAQCDKLGVSVGLIMCDALGDIGDADQTARNKAVSNHYPWVHIAQQLGAHSIRVNAAGEGSPDQLAVNATKGLSQLTDYAASRGVNVIVENHGGYSSDGQWLAGVIQSVASEHCGTLPDFGNFCIESDESGCVKEYDRYLGVQELAPYAKGLSAKAYAFDAEGNETTIDFPRMMKIARNAGYKGHVGIEYEGDGMTEAEGINATKQLLLKTFAAL
jgi:sugar phosphate isomerase/epimerase